MAIPAPQRLARDAEALAHFTLGRQLRAFALVLDDRQQALAQGLAFLQSAHSQRSRATAARKISPWSKSRPLGATRGTIVLRQVEG